MTSVNVAFTVYGATYDEIIAEVKSTLTGLGISESIAMTWDSELTVIPDDNTADRSIIRWKAEFLSRFSTTPVSGSTTHTK